MKRFAAILVLALGTALSAVAQDSIVGMGSVTGTLELSTGITELAAMASGPNAKATLASIQGKYILLFGTIGSTVSRSADGEPFSVTVELLAGAWEGTSKLVLHRIYVRFVDERFKDLLTKPEGKKIMAILGSPSLGQAADGGQVAVFQAVAVTKLN
jgi:hypothetical protein